MRRETGLSLTDAQIENMLAGHPCTVSEAVRGIVNQQGRKYTEHLLSATMEAGFDLHAIPAVLLGGGASVVSRHLVIQTIIPSMLDYYDTSHYIFVHGWIPCTVKGCLLYTSPLSFIITKDRDMFSLSSVVLFLIFI